MTTAETARKLVKAYEAKAAEQHAKDVECFCELFSQRIHAAASKGALFISQVISKIPNNISVTEFCEAMEAAGYTAETDGWADKIFIKWGE